MARRARTTPVSIPSPSTSKAAWKAFDRATSVAAGIAAPKVSQLVWRALSGRSAPAAGSHPDVASRDALAWALIGGGLAEATRVAVQRGAARYWQKSTGELPPGMKPLPQD